VLASIGVDYWRSRKLLEVAKRTGSTALATDAFHFASDIWSSLAVLAGLGFSWLGVYFGIFGLRYADPIAAVVVSLLILKLTVHLGWEAIGALTDKISPETLHKIVQEVECVPGVLAVEQVRVRQAGANYFADLTLAMPWRYTFGHTGKLAHDATEAVRRALPGADVVIHTVPQQARAESIFDRVRAVAARNNVSLHDLSVQTYRGKLHVEQHVELDERLTLKEAHNFICGLEAEILRETPEIDTVLTHIESEPATIEQLKEDTEDECRFEQELRTAALQFEEIVDVHEIMVGRCGEHISLSCHCTLPDELSMQRVHLAITELEDRFKMRCPEVYRVTIHPEPATDNSR
jgi:divalent metal cation (Fe/Co/Zn/Cd) transporter